MPGGLARAPLLRGVSRGLLSRVPRGLPGVPVRWWPAPRGVSRTVGDADSAAVADACVGHGDVGVDQRAVAEHHVLLVREDVGLALHQVLHVRDL